MERPTLFPPIVINVAPQESTATWTTTARSTDTAVARVTAVSSNLRSEGWVVALVVLASLGVAVTFGCQMYLTYRAVLARCRLGRVWLGQLLLASQVVSFLLVFSVAVRPTMASCGVWRAGVGMAFCLTFSILLLKLVALAAIHKGHRMPVFMQVLLLVFMVGVQVAISVQWVVLVPPEPSSGPQSTCDVSVQRWLLHLSYVMLLMVCGVAAAIVTRRVPLGHRETMFIGFAVGFSLPIWLVWALVGALLEDQDGKCLAFGLIANATLVLFAMFLPKSRQMAAAGETNLYGDELDIVDMGVGGGKPISELTVHRLYYPVYPTRGLEEPDSRSTPNTEVAQGTSHWYPPLNENSHYPSNTTQRASYHPESSSSSGGDLFFRVPTSSLGTMGRTATTEREACESTRRAVRAVGGCLTPRCEDGRRSVIHSANDDSDTEVAYSTERNIDGVSYIRTELPVTRRAT